VPGLLVLADDVDLSVAPQGIVAYNAPPNFDSPLQGDETKPNLFFKLWQRSAPVRRTHSSLASVCSCASFVTRNSRCIPHQLGGGATSAHHEMPRTQPIAHQPCSLAAYLTGSNEKPQSVNPSINRRDHTMVDHWWATGAAAHLPHIVASSFERRTYSTVHPTHTLWQHPQSCLSVRASPVMQR
jgi:hypothetical protein